MRLQLGLIQTNRDNCPSGTNGHSLTNNDTAVLCEGCTEGCSTPCCHQRSLAPGGCSILASTRGVQAKTRDDQISGWLLQLSPLKQGAYSILHILPAASAPAGSLQLVLNTSRY